MLLGEVLDVQVHGDMVTMTCKLCPKHCEVFSNQLRPNLSTRDKIDGIKATAEFIAKRVLSAHDLAKQLIDSMSETDDHTDEPPNGVYPYDM